MNKLLAVGAVAGAVVVALFVGVALRFTLGRPPAEPMRIRTATPEASSADPSAPDALLPEGPFAWFEAADPPEPHSDGPPDHGHDSRLRLDVPSTGVFSSCILAQGDEIETIRDQTAVGQSRQTPLESALIALSTTSAGILVYKDPCQWEYNVPHPPATTADDIAAALAAQPSRDASDPVDVTIGGYPGKMITLPRFPMTLRSQRIASEGRTRATRSRVTTSSGGVPWRWHQGPGQIDTFWIVEVDDAIVIMNAMYPRRHPGRAHRRDEGHRRVGQLRVDRCAGGVH